MHRFRPIVLLAVFLLLAAACGGDDEPTVVTVRVDVPGETITETVEVEVPGETITETVTETVTVEVTGAPSVGADLNVMAKWGQSGGEGAAFVKVLEAFEAKTGISVNYNGVGDALPTILSTQVAGGQPPDVAILPQPGLLGDLVALGALVSIEAAAGDALDADFAPFWRELGSDGGTLYGLAFKAANKSTVWYNVKVFAANGITPPTTWTEFVAAAQTLLDAGITPVAVAGADGWTLTDWFENVYLRTAGPEKYDQLAKGEIPWDDQSVKDALAKLGELIGVDDFVVGGSSGALQVNFGDSVKAVFSDTAEAAIVFEADFVPGVILNETNAQAGTDFDFFNFPSIDGSPPSILVGGDIAVVLKDSPEAMALIEFLATPEAAEVWAALGGYDSANQRADLAAYPDDIARRAAELLVTAEVLRFDISDLVPSCFGGVGGSGLWGGLQDWLGAPTDIDGVTAQLVADLAAC